MGKRARNVRRAVRSADVLLGETMSSRASDLSRAQMSSRAQRGICTSVVLGALMAVSPIQGQTVDSGCTYATCALNIVPRITALDVVRGNGEYRVASLAFLFPHGVASAFTPNESAVAHANAAFSRRRVASALIDAGAILLASAAAGVLVPAHRGVVAGAGVALIAGSVPIHFAADAELSRAVWEFNRQYTR